MKKRSIILGIAKASGLLFIIFLQSGNQVVVFDSATNAFITTINEVGVSCMLAWNGRDQRCEGYPYWI